MIMIVLVRLRFSLLAILCALSLPAAAEAVVDAGDDPGQSRCGRGKIIMMFIGWCPPRPAVCGI
jgi:hypothetical protein